jgi:hypothetical protein
LRTGRLSPKLLAMAALLADLKSRGVRWSLVVPHERSTR